MTRDELDPLDDEPIPALEPETEFSEEVSPDLDEVVDGTSETMDAEPELDDQADIEATDGAPAVSEAESLEPVVSPESDYDVQQQNAVKRFFEAYHAQRRPSVRSWANRRSCCRQTLRCAARTASSTRNLAGCHPRRRLKNWCSAMARIARKNRHRRFKSGGFRPTFCPRVRHRSRSAPLFLRLRAKSR